VYYALEGGLFCATCKEDSDRVRRKLTHYILRYERTFNVGFRHLFPGDEEFFGGEPVHYDDADLNTIPTEAQLLEQRIPDTCDEEIVIDVDENDFIETSIDPEDMSLSYKSGTTNTDDYVKGLVDELQKARKDLEGKSQ
jgi:hypothetical protein